MYMQSQTTNVSKVHMHSNKENELKQKLFSLDNLIVLAYCYRIDYWVCVDMSYCKLGECK